MKIAILSDSHDNLPNLLAALDHCAAQGVAALLHCGDLASTETLQALLEQFPGAVHLVTGNADYAPEAYRELAQKQHRLQYYGEVGQLTVPEGKLAWCHHPAQAKALAHTGRYRAVFYGHTHRPWEEVIGNCKLLNPGTIAGTSHRPTFALYDSATGNAKLILVDQLNAALFRAS